VKAVRACAQRLDTRAADQVEDARARAIGGKASWLRSVCSAWWVASAGRACQQGVRLVESCVLRCAELALEGLGPACPAVDTLRIENGIRAQFLSATSSADFL